MNKAYRIICERKLIDDGELQYILNLGHGSFYRIKKALLAMFPDISWENGFFKLKTEEKKVKEIPIDHWGELEPNAVKKK